MPTLEERFQEAIQSYETQRRESPVDHIRLAFRDFFFAGAWAVVSGLDEQEVATEIRAHAMKKLLGA